MRSLLLALVVLSCLSSGAGAAFNPINPCRTIDTRATEAPALVGQATRTFTMRGLCGIPASATALTYNATIVLPSGAGFLTLHPADAGLPTASSLNFGAGDVRGNAGVVALGASSPDLAIYLATNPPGGSAHLVLDITGYHGPPTCPADMVQVGGKLCIDRYEASVWTAPVGGSQLGFGVDNYAPCADNGAGCLSIFARSVGGVFPSLFITWFQAQQACANVGKRLPTNAEWQMAVADTPDSGGADDGTDTCNTDSGVPTFTGARSLCVSSWGAFDMIGNVDEWVADWVPKTTGNCVVGPSGDSDCIGDVALADGSAALVRGGKTGVSGALSGPLDVFVSDQLDIGPSFRCAKDLN